ncbi:DUF6507 family protein [Nocardiopsis sp. NPDC006198]|uniref:DUF6507 family protein n=1 Tax=Nocardiopsis sp. NPDC006198 TaxID=3154472 RepID=UPI0033A47388
MSSWNIQPAEVGGVLTTVAGHLGEEGGGDGLVGHITKVGEYVNLCAEEVGGGPVQASLAEVGEYYFGQMGDMVALTVSAVQGAYEATMSYIEGDLEMAAQHQAAAGEIPEPENTGPNIAV